MNTSHYPSLELCKRLTEAGFTGTEFSYIEKDGKNKIIDFDIHNHEIIGGTNLSKGTYTWEDDFGYWYENGYVGEDEIYRFSFSGKEYVCPSVMEMLDVMPLHREKLLFLSDREVEFMGFTFGNTLPNALAEMVLWLHQNNYISFTK